MATGLRHNELARDLTSLFSLWSTMAATKLPISVRVICDIISQAADHRDSLRVSSSLPDVYPAADRSESPSEEDSFERSTSPTEAVEVANSSDDKKDAEEDGRDYM